MLGHAALSDVSISDLAAQNYARVRLAGISVDIDALYIGPPISVNTSAANETDSAQSAAAPIAVNTGVSSETDSAGSATAQSEQLVDTGTASETDSAQSASVALSLSSPIGTFEPGNTVQITINKVIDSLTCSAGAVTLTTNNGSIIEFLAPEPPLFGDKTLTYNTAITFTATAGSETVEFDLPIQPRTSELFGEITHIDPAGIYADDTLNVGNFSHVKNIIGDVILDVSDGTHSNVAASSLEYALYDGVWSDYGTESFPAQDLIVNAGGASETDTAQPATPSTPGLVNVGEASEADSAGSATPGVGSGVEVAAGTASETDSAQAATPETPQSVGVGAASEADSAETATPQNGHSVNLGSSSENDAAGTATAKTDQSIDVGTAGETNTSGNATPVDGALAVAVGQGREVDQAPRLDDVTVAPSLAFIDTGGQSFITVDQFDSYSDPSWTWSDGAVDSQPVDWSGGEVDTSVPGIYVRIAGATNAAGPVFQQYHVVVRSITPSTVGTVLTLQASPSGQPLVSASGIRVYQAPILLADGISSNESGELSVLVGGVDGDSERYIIQTSDGSLSAAALTETGEELTLRDAVTGDVMTNLDGIRVYRAITDLVDNGVTDSQGRLVVPIDGSVGDQVHLFVTTQNNELSGAMTVTLETLSEA